MEWISVDDKFKPEDGESVLVSYNSNFGTYAGMMTAAFYGNSFYSGGSYAIRNVTHWARPEPPKEQQ